MGLRKEGASLPFELTATGVVVVLVLPFFHVLGRLRLTTRPILLREVRTVTRDGAEVGIKGVRGGADHTPENQDRWLAFRSLPTGCRAASVAGRLNCHLSGRSGATVRRLQLIGRHPAPARLQRAGGRGRSPRWMSTPSRPLRHSPPPWIGRGPAGVPAHDGSPLDRRGCRRTIVAKECGSPSGVPLIEARGSRTLPRVVTLAPCWLSVWAWRP